MARNISTVLFYDNLNLSSSFIVPAGTSVNLDINLTDIFNYQALIEVAYTSTSGTTGLTCQAFYGWGPQDPVNSVGNTVPVVLESLTGGKGPNNVYWSDCGYSSVTTGDPIALVAFTPSSGAQVKRTPFYGADPLNINPRWMRLKFTNTDVTNSATVRIWIDA
jgi:hypothetical protein